MKKSVLILIFFLAIAIFTIVFLILSNILFVNTKSTSQKDEFNNYTLDYEFGVKLPYDAKIVNFERPKNKTDFCLAKVIIKNKDFEVFIKGLNDYQEKKNLPSEMPSHDTVDWWRIDVKDVNRYYLRFYSKKINGELCRGGELSIIILNKIDNKYAVYFSKAP